MSWKDNSFKSQQRERGCLDSGLFAGGSDNPETKVDSEFQSSSCDVSMLVVLSPGKKEKKDFKATKWNFKIDSGNIFYLLLARDAA